MNSTNMFKKIMAEQEAKRAMVMDTSNRAQSALALAKMALDHSGSGSEAAAKLLLAMENEHSFDFMLLLNFDSTNRAHADLVMMGYKSSDLWPSGWLESIGVDGKEIMLKLRKKWSK